MLFMISASLYVFNLDYEFDTVKSFPEELPSRVGYEIVESRFDKGELAPTSLLVEREQALTEQQKQELTEALLAEEEIASDRPSSVSEDQTKLKLSMTFDLNPYDPEAIDNLEEMRENSADYFAAAGIDGELHFAGTTAKLLDERDVNNGDIIKIVVLETILILVLLFVLTKSWKMP